MKITPEHYNHMRDAIKATVSKFPVEAYRASIIAEGKATDVEKRVRWDYSYAAKLTPWLCANVYAYANDGHIDTALRCIMRELIEA